MNLWSVGEIYFLYKLYLLFFKFYTYMCQLRQIYKIIYLHDIDVRQYLFQNAGPWS